MSAWATPLDTALEHVTGWQMGWARWCATLRYDGYIPTLADAPDRGEVYAQALGQVRAAMQREGLPYYDVSGRAAWPAPREESLLW